MSVRRYAFYFLPILFAAILIGLPTKSQYFKPKVQTLNQESGLIAGRNVNMVSGTKLPLGDPWLQRQNEPSIAVSSRNPMHLFAAANDYRTIDISDNYNLRGIPGLSAVRDSWVGVFESFDYGESWVTTLLPGFPQDTSAEGLASPIHGFNTACDPIVRAGAKGLFYFSGIAFNRSQQAGAVFVARYVDLNNRENVEEDIDPLSGYKKYVGPIEYMGTKLVDTGNSGQFIDMPNMAVDVPRSGAEYGNVYVAYTVFLGNTDINVRSRIVFVRSKDGGVTWSSPIKLTESQHIIQRPVIAIDPSDFSGKTIYVVFRRFANANVPGGIVFVKSFDGGVSFTKPIDVAPLLNPFDQPTTAKSFRTNSYPTMAVDGNGTAYLAWAQRYGQDGLPNPDGQARIVISYLPKGSLTWCAPQIVDNTYAGAGHQFMPTMTFGGGKLMLAWYDQRDDFNLSNAKFIEDGNGLRHTIDVRAAEGMPGTPPVFQPSIPVSRYLFYMELDDNGNPIGELIQGEADFINYPLFELGTKPFHGDYMEIASAPQILPPPATLANSWIFNTNSPEPTTFPVAWTSNRNVWPPAGNLWGDWTNYHPPTSIQDGDFGQTSPCSNMNNTGMKNQNVYTANLNHGIIVGSPGNTKQLNTERTFVVFVKNTTNIAKSLQLTISEIGGVGASFDQFNSGKSSLNVDVTPYSSVSTTVYVNSNSNNFAPVRVDVKEGGPIVGYVILNPDSTNNLILDPEGGNLGNEQHSPKISNPKIFKYDVGNPNEPNASFLGPRAENPRAENSGYVNPRAENVGIKNPRAENPRAENMNVKNENFVNYELKNPRAENPRAENTALTDMTWTVTNDGNTTSAYTFDIRSTVADYFNGDNPPLIAQILVYKVHTVPIDNGCELYQTHADELILNVSNPRAENPRAENTAPASKNIAKMRMSATAQDLGTQDVTFHLAPGEKAEVTLRVYDPNINDAIAFNTQTVAAETTAEAGDTGATEPPEPVEQPNIPWVNPLATMVAVPSSLSFNGPAPPGQNISLYLFNPPAGSLSYSATVDSSWLSVTPTSPNLPTTLAVTVNTTGLNGSYTGFITVTVPEASNNPLRIPVFLYVGAYNAPSMDIRYVYPSENYLPDGGSFDFGACAPGSTTDVTFDIFSSGGDLILKGQPIITIMGANANQFSVQQQPTSPVTSGNYTSFKIRFQPTSAGLKTATISIANNTLGTNPYDITLSGTGVVEANLVAYYPFNGNANDESGNSNNGTVSGATLTQDRFGNPNSAYNFDGVSNYIAVPDSPTLDITGPITIAAWIKPTVASGNYVVTKGDPTVGGFVYDLDIYPGSVRSLFHYQGGGSATRGATGATSIVSGVWQHVAVTWDGATVTVYYDGQPDGTGPFNINTDGPIRTSNMDLEIGRYFYGGQLCFAGAIDEVYIYNRALSASEIQALYSLGTGLVAYYPFNGNANDESGNGLNGTPVGAALANDRHGNANSAYSFNGEDDEITVQSNSLLDITGPISLAAWIYPLEQKTQHIVRRSAAAIGPYGLSTSDTGDIIFELSFSGVLQQVRKSGYTLNAWSLIVGTWDGSAMRLYVNGALVASQSRSGTIDTRPNDTFLIGTRLMLPADTFNGKLDEIRIYDRALSSSEIVGLYSANK